MRSSRDPVSRRAPRTLPARSRRPCRARRAWGRRERCGELVDGGADLVPRVVRDSNPFRLKALRTADSMSQQRAPGRRDSTAASKPSFEALKYLFCSLLGSPPKTTTLEQSDQYPSTRTLMSSIPESPASMRRSLGPPGYLHLVRARARHQLTHDRHRERLLGRLHHGGAHLCPDLELRRTREALCRFARTPFARRRRSAPLFSGAVSHALSWSCAPSRDSASPSTTSHVPKGVSEESQQDRWEGLQFDADLRAGILLEARAAQDTLDAVDEAQNGITERSC